MRMTDANARLKACMANALIAALLCGLLLSGCKKQTGENSTAAPTRETAESMAASTKAAETTAPAPTEPARQVLAPHCAGVLAAQDDAAVQGSLEILPWDSFLWLDLERREDDERSWFDISGLTTAEAGNLRVEGSLYFGPEDLLMDLDIADGAKPSAETLLTDRLKALDEKAELTEYQNNGLTWKMGTAFGAENGKAGWTMAAAAKSTGEKLIVLQLDAAPGDAAENDEAALKATAEKLKSWFDTLTRASKGENLSSGKDAVGSVLWLTDGEARFFGPDADLLDLGEFRLSINRMGGKEALFSVDGIAKSGNYPVSISARLALSKGAQKPLTAFDWTTEKTVKDGVLLFAAAAEGVRTELSAVLLKEDPADAEYDDLCRTAEAFLGGCGLD